jgi:hypothetical protein
MLDSRLASLLPTCVGICVCATSTVSAESITQDVIIDSDFPTGEPLEKAIDYFDGGSIPSVVVGNGRGGMYLYRSSTGTLDGPWKRSIINPNGSAYERARPLRFKGETYPGLIASLSNQIVWLQNPRNRPDGDIADPWPLHVINPDHGCHDIRLFDLDGDGKIDVICSGAISLRGPQFVAFQDDPTHWNVIYDIADVGDDIALLKVRGSDVPNLVGAAHSGETFWYENPRSTGGSARRPHWTRHLIGPGNVGNSFAAGPFSSPQDSVISAPNEHEGPGGVTDERGIVWYEQPDNPTAPWIPHNIGPDYRDIHEVSMGTWNDGTPYVLVAEQENACPPAMPEGNPPTHPGVPCRITLFQWTDGELRSTVLTHDSTHNQAITPWHGGLLMADANHGAYGGSTAVHLRLIMP